MMINVLALASGAALPESMLAKGGVFCFSRSSRRLTSSLDVLSSPSFLGKTGDRVAWVLEHVDAAMARDIRPFSMVPREDEILLMPNCRFEVKGSLDTGNGLRLVQVQALEVFDAIIASEFGVADEEW
jgi:hypothetical protein